MHPFPHHYTATSFAGPDGDLRVESGGLPALATAAPAEFGGPGDRWSPETLLTAAVADCFALTFRAVARATGLAWTALRCEAEGTLDREDRTTRFTAFRLRASLTVPAGTDTARALGLLERAERACLISNSLNAAVHLDAEVVVEEMAIAA
ncbi:MAG TPA: OsmC family protein [Rubricoccaceae bacterium]|nr:OsmC family protein [Rubricoccaceae bacterium]